VPLVPVAALLLVQFSAALLPFGIGALAPFLRTDYGMQRGEVGLAGSLIFAAVAICSVPAGRLTDRVGIVRAMTGACLIVAVGTAGIAVGGTVSAAFALVVVGIGYSLVTPSTNKGVIAAAPEHLRGRSMGIKQMGVTAGGAVSAAVLPSAVERVGLRLTLVAAASTVAAIGLGAVAAFRWSVRPRKEPPSPRGPLPSAGTGSRRRILTLGSAIGAMVAAQHIVAIYLTLFLVDRRSMGATGAAAYLTMLHASGTVARLGWGWVSDRIGSRLRTATLIGTLSVASLLTLAAVGARVPALVLAGLVLVLGAATQGGNAVYQIAIAEEDVARAGWASGVGMTLGFSGAIVAPPAFGAFVDATGSYAAGLSLTAGVVVVAVIVIARLAREVDPACGRSPGIGGRRSEVPDDAKAAEDQRIDRGFRRGGGIHRPGEDEEPLHLPEGERVDRSEARDPLLDP
jgi:MFS family permease